jgi:hypothetical protein
VFGFWWEMREREREREKRREEKWLFAKKGS